MIPSSSSKPLDPKDAPMEYLLAHFGTKVPHEHAQFELAMAKPAEACTALENDVKGKMVLVRRGGCPFVKKAEQVNQCYMCMYVCIHIIHNASYVS